jgi:hypothetical protein
MGKFLELNLWWQLNGFHHLTKHPISQNDYWGSIFIGKVERLKGQIGDFCRARPQYDVQ